MWNDNNFFEQKNKTNTLFGFKKTQKKHFFYESARLTLTQSLKRCVKGGLTGITALALNVLIMGNTEPLWSMDLNPDSDSSTAAPTSSGMLRHVQASQVSEIVVQEETLGILSERESGEAGAIARPPAPEPRSLEQEVAWKKSEGSIIEWIHINGTWVPVYFTQEPSGCWISTLDEIPLRHQATALESRAQSTDNSGQNTPENTSSLSLGSSHTSPEECHRSGRLWSFSHESSVQPPSTPPSHSFTRETSIESMDEAQGIDAKKKPCSHKVHTCLTPTQCGRTKHLDAIKTALKEVRQKLQDDQGQSEASGGIKKRRRMKKRHPSLASLTPPAQRERKNTLEPKRLQRSTTHTNLAQGLGKKTIEKKRHRKQSNLRKGSRCFFKKQPDGSFQIVPYSSLSKTSSSVEE